MVIQDNIRPPPMSSMYSEIPQVVPVVVEENPSSHHHTNETSPFLKTTQQQQQPQHKKQLPNSIQSVPIALAPTILPLTYNPNKKHYARNRHVLCQFRGIFALIMGFFLLAILIHYIVWLCLKRKDTDMSLMKLFWMD